MFKRGNDYDIHSIREYLSIVSIAREGNLPVSILATDDIRNYIFHCSGIDFFGSRLYTLVKSYRR